MGHDFDVLIQSVVDGDSGAFQRLQAALRDAGGESLLAALRHEHTGVRIAAVQAAKGTTDPEARAAVRKLAKDPTVRVRRALATALAEAPDWPLDSARRILLEDKDENVRADAVKAVPGLPEWERMALLRLEDDGSWEVRQAAAEVLGQGRPSVVLTRLLVALGRDEDRDVSRAAATSAEGLLESAGGWPEGLEPPPFGMIQECGNRVGALGADRFPLIAAWAEERVTHGVDMAVLADYGTDLTEHAAEGRIARAHGVDEAIEAIRSIIEGEAPRAAVLLGESGSGKTAIAHELCHRLSEEGWRVLRIAPAEMLSGTMYLGEWETRLDRLVKAVCWPRRVLLYFPNIHELTQVGRSAVSDSNLATMFGPRIESGDIVVLGESTPDAFAAGMGKVRSVRRLFTSVEVAPAGPEKTRAIVEEVAAECGVEWEPEELDAFLELADAYVPGQVQPGRSVGLLRRVLEAHPDTAGEFRVRPVLETLSTSTGIPVELLDDGTPLDLGKTRGFFADRVMGQEEAVEAVIDLVTLVKAGLTDPEKPFGVLFFVGPTGVGKTEMARALAELIFGDPSRLIRFDMSEFATYDAFERLIGRGEVPGLLTSAVREKPLAVILLDEIEKSHPNIFDLCLQIFDAGRLTDAKGRTADFRRTIIILTSNIGSTVPAEDSFGFGGSAPPPPERDTTLREVQRFFRPEFLNRLDRMVVFKALSEATAERIARREVSEVIARSGIQRRSLSVEVDPSVIALLLRRGYSPAFGARPLKRTVEQLVLLPVARAISTGAVAVGSILFVKVVGQHVVVEVTPPEREDGEKPVAAETVEAIDDRLRGLIRRIEEFGESAVPHRERKADLIDHSGQPGFWDDRPEALRTMDEIHRLDGMLGALDAFGKRVRGLERNAARRKRTPLGTPKDLETVAALEAEAGRVGFLLDCRDATELGDALVTVTLVRADGKGLGGVGRLAEMYAGLARRRRLEVEVLDDRRGGEPFEDSISLSISGAGAYGLLRGEAGLHHVAREVKERGRAKAKEERDVLRVEILPAPEADAGVAAGELKIRTGPLRGKKGRLIPRPKTELTVLHVGSMTSVKAWTDAAKDEAVERVMPMLLARRTAAEAPAEAGQGAVVRRYVLGPTPMVRDRRTGRSTGRLDKVLAGDLDLFLTAP